MAEGGFNLQDEFLKRARNDRISVVVFLTNKVQLHGQITGYDRYVILLESAGKQQMIFKHAVTTITPNFPLNLKITRPAGKDAPDNGSDSDEKK
ncbi:MAG TPA: RNA chaperone Hfq [bacterium]|nr:RNA chaperone Hfq [bacterium]